MGLFVKLRVGAGIQCLGGVRYRALCPVWVGEGRGQTRGSWRMSGKRQSRKGGLRVRERAGGGRPGAPARAGTGGWPAATRAGLLAPRRGCRVRGAVQASWGGAELPGAGPPDPQLDPRGPSRPCVRGGRRWPARPRVRPRPAPQSSPRRGQGPRGPQGAAMLASSPRTRGGRGKGGRGAGVTPRGAPWQPGAPWPGEGRGRGSRVS